MTRLHLFVAMATLTASLNSYASPDVICNQVGDAPKIDGKASDSAWAYAKRTQIKDAVADIKHELSCVYSGEKIYLLISFPDNTENRQHKTLVWDKEQSRYRTSIKREDTVVLKWNMEPGADDISLTADNPYKADIWYWKAYRSDHAGYADDKFHIYTNEPLRKSKKLISKSGQRFYLARRGDQGKASYKSRIYTEFTGDEVEGYEFVKPTESRADITARGLWKDGVWNIEFSRRLETGHSDDVQLKPGRRYLFGVSRFEIAGRLADNNLEIPEFGSGDLGEMLHLVIGDKSASNK